MAQHRRGFEAGVESVAQARRFVTHHLADSGADLFAAALLTSELATNAVIHARSPFEVWLRTRPGTLRVEVRNDDPELLLSMKEPSDARGGRGLQIVDALATDWGAQSERDHKLVWFELRT